ncbi:hypothetical protein tloyanaT_28490 [Thalassotalea loyana]|uniref:5-carboxymethyl-2-hydroxymuconate Delta-isomerase n=1 Tax=Thalassotalea loyana TaxID=280483 RepID=A0ABQ6HI51_9GAMM|nr:5-carboxymethyl-2-hydroxymuconate isomerase [Thalassotalea loyana]GLX86596.1 hypothetical protein tloyanaT_28490 [Thalassotalea loyana]
MPHCIIEHSDNFMSEALIRKIHQACIKSSLFNEQGSDIKVRAQPFSHFKSGATDLNFIHVELKILPGRTQQQKQTLSQLALEGLLSLEITECSISVEVTEIDITSYAKKIV